MKPTINIQFKLEDEDIEAIKVWAVKHKMSLQKLCEKVKITYQWLNALFNGKQKMSQELYIKFKELGVFDKETLLKHKTAIVKGLRKEGF